MEQLQVPEGFYLRQVQVIIRHGLRTPITQLPGVEAVWECHSRNSVVPLGERGGTCFTGQLTSLGAQQLEELGSMLRSRYSTFLAGEKARECCYVRSTHRQRTIESAQHLLRGLFGPEQAGEVAVHVALFADENMVARRDLCPRLEQRWQQVARGEKSVEMQDFLARTFPGTKLHSWFGVWNTVETLTAHGHAVPDAGGLTYEDYRRLGSEHTSLLYADAEVTRLSIGTFLHDVVEAFSAPQKVRVWSGHDDTLSPLIRALTGSLQEHPPMGSYVLLELLERREDSELFVRAFYNGKPLLEMARLEELQGNTSLLTRAEYARECQLLD